MRAQVDMGESLRALQAPFAQLGASLSRIGADGVVLERAGRAPDWLPPVGHSCFEAPTLAGMEADFAHLRAHPGEALALPGVRLAGEQRLLIAIVWSVAENCFFALTMPDHGAAQLESLLVGERRAQQLAEEQAAAAQKRARVSEAYYRDIVERDVDLVLRLNGDGVVVFANRRGLDQCGPIVGARAGAQLAGEGGAWGSIRADGPEASFEQRLRTPRGDVIWVWWRVTWLGAGGGPQEFQAVGRDVTLLRNLRADVERANAEARHALVMRERLKIAHDLHDSIVHSLVAVSAQLRLVRKMQERAPDMVEPELARAEDAVRDGLARTREAVGQVRFERAGLDGLGPALTRACRRLQERTGIAVEADVDPLLNGVFGERAEVVYRIIEEALRNIEAHSGAARAQLVARSSGGEIEVVLTDNGRGFDTQAKHPGHYGLIGMDEQARMIGGSVVIQSTPGQGVRTIVRAPQAQQEKKS
ncbi:MAG: hypothetical protein KGL46_02135 [Hyphomicrobiales bacterium]|nr:hypothetical protein [Hyphomicrobiales bacterium]